MADSLPSFIWKHEGDLNGPIVEKGDSVRLIWRKTIFLQSKVAVDKSTAEGETFAITDEQHWTYQLIGSRNRARCQVRVNDNNKPDAYGSHYISSIIISISKDEKDE